MLLKSVSILASIVALVCLSSQAIAQRGGGGQCGAGARATGGMMTGRAGGRATTGTRRGRGNRNAPGNLMTLGRLQQGGRQNSPRVQNNRPQPTAAQFARTAMGFDRDQDQQLNRNELNQVAAAVISELQSRRQATRQRGRRQPRSSRSAAGDISEPNLTQQMQEAFVNRAMTFDRDNDGVLTSAETIRMATALIRSLS